jgi:hypothetical protein
LTKLVVGDCGLGGGILGAPGGLRLVVMLRDVNFVGVCVCCRFRLLWRLCVNCQLPCSTEEYREIGRTGGLPFGAPPPKPVILFNLAEPPALILASRRSLRMRACSAALEGGELPVHGEDGTGVVSAILSYSFKA